MTIMTLQEENYYLLHALHVETVRALLIMIDHELTGKSLEYCFHTYDHRDREPGWLDFDGKMDEYYLSDGGYSRLCSTIIWDQEHGPKAILTFLTQNSRHEVSDRMKNQSTKFLLNLLEKALFRIFKLNMNKEELIGGRRGGRR